jgi:hypothetical protein
MDWYLAVLEGRWCETLDQLANAFGALHGVTAGDEMHDLGERP